jgi:hypothetical protein
MTWTSAARSAAEIAARSAGAPYLMGHHIGDGLRPIWTSDTGAHTDADESATGAPAYFAIDRSGARETYPTGTADEWWLSFGAISDIGGLPGIDSLLLLSNLGGLGFDVTVAVEVADNAAYSTNLETVHAFVPTQAMRWVDHFDDRWFGDAGSYIRLHFTAATAFTPRIRECWIGRTRQLRGLYSTGRDAFGTSSGLDIAGAERASTTARDKAVGRNVWPVRLRLKDNAPSLLDTASARDWWADIDSGAAPFVWHPRPSTSQHDARIMATEAEGLDLPRENGPAEQHLEQTWREMPPYRATEV